MLLRRFVHVAALISNFRSTLNQTKKPSFFHLKLNCLDCHKANLNNIHSSFCVSSTRSNITLVCLLRNSSVHIRRPAALSPQRTERCVGNRGVGARIVSQGVDVEIVEKKSRRRSNGEEV